MVSLSNSSRVWFVLLLVAACVAAASAGSPPTGQSGPSSPATTAACRVVGHVTSGRDPLPGASVMVRAGDALKTATSTDVDGSFSLSLEPGASYRLAVELTAFTTADRTITLTAPPCDQTVDIPLTLAARRPREIATASARPGRGFQTLAVQADAAGEAAPGASPDEAADAARLLPAGFSLQTAQADAVAIAGSGDAASLDRGGLNDRAQAIALGQFDPATGQFAQGFGPQGVAAGADGGGPPGQFGGRGGPGGGRGGPGGFTLGGRGARGQSPYQGTATYTFGGSALSTPPYQLNPAVPATQPQFAQNTFGTTFGGPLKIPGLYKDTNRRTQLPGELHGQSIGQRLRSVRDRAHGGNAGRRFLRQRGSVDRSGHGPAVPGQPDSVEHEEPGGAVSAWLHSPAQPSRRSAQLPHVHARAQFVRQPQPPVHAEPVIDGSAERTRLRRARRRVRRTGGGGPAARGTNIVLQGQLQYRRTENEALNVFPGLGSTNTNTSLTVPLSLNIVHNRTVNNFSVNVAHSHSDATNEFAHVQNVGGLAGINYPTTASSDPQNWGVPRLSFTGFTGVFGAPATSRSDTRITTSYFWLHPSAKHQLRIGGDYRFDRSTGVLNTNAPGAFTFTGLYSSGGVPVSDAAGNSAAFADFLLGIPQQAALQVGGQTELRGRSFDAYVEDNWQKSSKLTVNLGLRYELVAPYTEANGLLANLDAAPGFTSVVPVQAGGTGPFTGPFPEGLINTDTNNIGPRVGFAYRPVRGTVVRGGYSITYNPSSYANIARRLAAQPPAAVTETIVAGLEPTLDIENALLTPTSSTTNNWGVDKSYGLGLIQTWNASVSRDVTQSWNILASYTGVKGADLDLLSAPNRGPGGTLSIPDVQPFTWEASGGHSILNLGNIQLTRRLAHGVAGSASYTLSKSMDNTPSLGSASTVVEQDPNNPAAEWAPSNFDRRQQFAANFAIELPFGANRRWLDKGGLFSAVLGGWTATGTFTAQSGTPFTARVCGAATDIAQGTNCSLRGDSTGLPIQLANPTVESFFNTSAFVAAAPGVFGDAARNTILGPGGQQLNATLTRDVRLNGTRAVTLQVNAVNLLNTVQWTVLDTDINSPTFGHVISVKPMRAVTMGLRFRF